MARQSSAGKRGLKSAAVKQRTSRHDTGSIPATRPVAGAYGREGRDRRTGGKLRTPAPARRSKSTKAGARTAKPGARRRAA